MKKLYIKIKRSFSNFKKRRGISISNYSTSYINLHNEFKTTDYKYKSSNLRFSKKKSEFLKSRMYKYTRVYAPSTGTSG